jgi:hypothetical protein
MTEKRLERRSWFTLTTRFEPYWSCSCRLLRIWQPVAIPSYLLAIAVGNLCYKPFPRPIGKQWSSGLWAEPELLDAAFWEFSGDTTR